LHVLDRHPAAREPRGSWTISQRAPVTFIAHHFHGGRLWLSAGVGRLTIEF
jgi:hypothetical protein